MRYTIFCFLLSASAFLMPLTASANGADGNSVADDVVANGAVQLMKTAPKAGTIVKETDNNVLNFKQMVLSNGIKVILKKTDLDRNEVIVSAQCSGGASCYGMKDWANTKLFDLVVQSSGLGDFSNEQLKEFLAGKDVAMELSMSDTHCLVEGFSTPDNLQTLFEMMHLCFTDIKADTVTFNSLVHYLDAGMSDQSNLSEKAFNDSVIYTIYHHDQRMRSLEKKDLRKVSLDRIMNIAKEITANPAAYTFTIVGNFDEEKIRTYLETYIASLSGANKTMTGHRVGSVAKGIVKNNFTNTANKSVCNALMYWHNDKMKWNLQNRVRAEVAGQILNIIYTHILPEVDNKTITAGAYGKVIHYEDGYTISTIVAQCPIKPESRDSVIPLLRNAVYLLSKKCDAALLENAKLKFLMLEEEKLKTNSYWFDILADYNKYGINLYTDYAKYVSIIKPQDICDFMTEFLKGGNRIEVCMSPAK